MRRRSIKTCSNRSSYLLFTSLFQVRKAGRILWKKLVVVVAGAFYITFATNSKKEAYDDAAKMLILWVGCHCAFHCCAPRWNLHSEEISKNASPASFDVPPGYFPFGWDWLQPSFHYLLSVKNVNFSPWPDAWRKKARRWLCAQIYIMAEGSQFMALFRPRALHWYFFYVLESTVWADRLSISRDVYSALTYAAPVIIVSVIVKVSKFPWLLSIFRVLCLLIRILGAAAALLGKLKRNRSFCECSSTCDNFFLFSFVSI